MPHLAKEPGAKTPTFLYIPRLGILGGCKSESVFCTATFVWPVVLCAGQADAGSDTTPQVPIRNFAKTPDFVDIKISPTGKYFAMRFPFKDNFGLAVFSISPVKVTAKRVLGEHHGIGDCK